MCSSKDFRFCERPQSHVCYKSFHEVPRCALISLSRPWIYYVTAAYGKPQRDECCWCSFSSSQSLSGSAELASGFGKDFRPDCIHGRSGKSRALAGRWIIWWLCSAMFIHGPQLGPILKARANLKGEGVQGRGVQGAHQEWRGPWAEEVQVGACHDATKLLSSSSAADGG